MPLSRFPRSYLLVRPSPLPALKTFILILAPRITDRVLISLSFRKCPSNCFNSKFKLPRVGHSWEKWKVASEEEDPLSLTRLVPLPILPHLRLYQWPS
ncbi:hypothetical protein JCM16303_005831 [Sporobolomyces ruberrimus]